MSKEITRLRSLLPACRKYKLLNFAATAPLLQPSAERMAALAQQGTEPIACHFDEWLALIENGRDTVARLIGAGADEISFTGNTSTGLSLVAAAIRWQPGDRVIYDSNDFPSNRFVWDNLASLGVQVETVSSSAKKPFTELIREMDLGKVKLVSVSAVSYLDGRAEDIRKLVEHCHTHQVMVCVDAIQAVGQIPVDVKQWGCDFLACGGQKWLLGPVGSGFIYIADSVLEQLHVPLVGWASIKNAGDFHDKRLVFIEGARRFEPGLPDITAIAGLTTSIETLAACGFETIHAQIAHNADYLRAALAELGYRITGQALASRPNGILCVELNSPQTIEDIYAACQNRQVLITKRDRQLRIAPHAVTSKADMDALLDVFGQFRRAVSRSWAGIASPRSLSAAAVAEQVETGQALPATASDSVKTALVTGASRGLGEAIAIALAKRGYQLTLLGREAAKLQRVADNIEAEFNLRPLAVELDLNKRDELTAWLQSLSDRQPFDVLVNNAAQGDVQLFVDSEIDKTRSLFEINYFSACAITQHFLPAMLAKKRGAILNIVTTGSRCGVPLFSGYNASKAALWSWSETLARELAGHGIQVMTFIPPHMDTNMAKYLGRRALPYIKLNKNAAPPASPYYVGERAVRLLLAGRSRDIPFDSKIKLLANTLSDKLFTRSISKYWRD